MPLIIPAGRAPVPAGPKPHTTMETTPNDQPAPAWLQPLLDIQRSRDALQQIGAAAMALLIGEMRRANADAEDDDDVTPFDDVPINGGDMVEAVCGVVDELIREGNCRPDMVLIRVFYAGSRSSMGSFTVDPELDDDQIDREVRAWMLQCGIDPDDTPYTWE